MSGAASFGIGQVFDGLAKATFASEFLRGVTHGYVGGMMSGMQGGDFLSGFASAALSSFMSSGYGAATKNALSAGTLGQADYTAGMLAVGALSGGVGAELTGGKFWQGAGQGFIVAALNHVAHELSSAQQEKKFQKTLEKYNEIVKNSNGFVSSAIDIAKQFTPEELTWLRRTGRIAKGIGWVTMGADGYLLYDAATNSQPWGTHAYHMLLGGIGQAGLPGMLTATGIDSYVGAGKFFIKMVNTINTQGPQWMMNKIKMWY